MACFSDDFSSIVGAIRTLLTYLSKGELAGGVFHL